MASSRGRGRKIAEPPTFLLGTLFVLGILDAGVQHVLQGESKGFCDDLQFLQSEVTLVQLAFPNSTADDIAHELLNFLRCRFFEAARGAFDGVREADDATLPILRPWSAVSKALLAYVRNVFLPNVHDFPTFPGIPLLMNGSFVKVSNQRCSMVLLNDIDDPLIEAVFEREIHTLFNMRNDDQSAHGGSKVIVGVFIADNVLREIIGFYQLAD